jgi:hypothetical protein
MPAISPYTAQLNPGGSTGFVTDYDMKLAEAAQKRLMAKKLMDMGLAPTDTQGLAPGARLSPLVPMAKMLTTLLGSQSDKQAAESEAATKTAQQDALTKLLGNMPGSEQNVPGTPSMPGMGGVGDPGGPMTDASAAMPRATDVGGTPATTKMLPNSPADWMKFQAQLAGVGGQGKAISEDITKTVLPSLLPKQKPGLMAVGGDVYDPSKAGTPGAWDTGPSTQARIAETAGANADRFQARQDAIDQRREAATANAKNAADKIAADAQYHQDMLALRRDTMASAPKEHRTTAGMDAMTGLPVVQDANGQRHATLADGTIDPAPFKGETIPQAAHEKNVTGVMSGMNEAAMADTAAKVIQANPDAFDSPRVRAGTAVGLPTPALGLTEGGQQARAYVGRDFAETTKKLYGASFTESEQKRGNAFTITAGDNAQTAANKARTAASFAREMANKYGTGAAVAAARRMSGTGGGAAQQADPATSDLRSKYGL